MVVGQDCVRAGSKPRLPIGVSSYRAIVAEGLYFVDKTLLIRDVVEDGAQVVLFTRPRRFGKTLNMDMLRAYFEIPFDGAPDPSDLFEGRLVASCGGRVAAHRGAHPVVSLTFKDVKFSTWDGALAEIARLVQSEVVRHAYLLESDACDAMERAALGRLYRLEADEAEVAGALLLLSTMLKKHHGAPAVISIDEYDVPIQQGHRYGYYDAAVRFMRVFFSKGFKDNGYLYKGFMTGILRVAKEGIFSGLNNLRVASVLDDDYAECFGFTPQEVRAMADSYGTDGAYAEACAWYDGYRFGNRDMFNPWSIANYFDNGCRPQPYWVSTSDNAILGELLSQAGPDLADDLRLLIAGGSVRTPIDIGIVYPQVAKDPSSVWSYLLMAGYLKAEVDTQTPLGETWYRMEIPNKEVSLVYRREVLAALDDVIPPRQIGPVQDAVVKGDGDALQAALGDLLARVASVRDAAGEGFYHGFMLGLVAMLDGLGYKVRSNRESGSGYFDVALEPVRPSLPGVVMEFKACRAEGAGPEEVGRKLDALADEALAQLADRDYARELRASGSGRVIAYGVAFCGKRVCVKRA